MKSKFSIRMIDKQGYHLSFCKENKFCFYFQYSDLKLFETKEKAIRYFEKNILKKDGCNYYIMSYSYDRHFKQYNGKIIHFFQ